MTEDGLTPSQRRVRAKRKTVSVEALKKKAEAGEDITDSRALIRMGKANTKILTGQEDLTLWDDEELLRGQRKDKNGRFQGRPPKVVPLALHREITRRQMEKAAILMRDNVAEAVQCLIDIIKGQDAEDKDRIKAAGMIIDRVMGTAPVKVEVEAVKSKFEEFGDSVVVWADDDSIIDVREVPDEDAG